MHPALIEKHTHEILIIVHNTGSKSRRRPNLSDSLFSYTGNRDAIALFQSVRKNIRSPSDHQRRAYQPLFGDNLFLVKIHFLGSILSVHKLFDSGISTGGGRSLLQTIPRQVCIPIRYPSPRQEFIPVSESSLGIHQSTQIKFFRR